MYTFHFESVIPNFPDLANWKLSKFATKGGPTHEYKK